MSCLRRMQKLLSWFVCLTILTAALMPALTQAVRAGTGQDWIEVCSTMGSKFVRIGAAAADGGSQDEPVGQAMQQCSFCALHVTALGLPPTPPAAVFIVLPLSFGPPELFYTAPRPLFAWARAQPRAPPLHA